MSAKKIKIDINAITQSNKPEGNSIYMQASKSRQDKIGASKYRGSPKYIDSTAVPTPFGIGVRLVAFVFTLLVFAAIPVALVKVVSKMSAFLQKFNINLSANEVTAAIVAEPRLKTDAFGRTNVLLLGIDSRGDIDTSGLKNTDSIMVVSYDPKHHALFMLSFPRDLYVKFPGTYYHNKINAVYAYGERIKKGKGFDYIKQVIEELSGLKIQYYAMINFDAFRKVIDRLGGIDVYVERSFVDYSYPTENYGYKTVRFKKGWQHFNGERALEYARSRKAAGPEGSDFARARRQQKVIQAIVDKIKKQGIKDPKFFYDMLKIVSKNVKMSTITPLDIEAGLKILQKGKPKTYSLVLDPTIGNYSLIGRGNTTLYTLVPKAGLDNWQLINRYIKDWFKCPEIIEKNPVINIYNSGDRSFWQHYKQIQGRFPYFKMRTATFKADIDNLISASPTGKLEKSAEFLASQLKFLEYIESDKLKASIKNKLNKDDLVIILGSK